MAMKVRGLNRKSNNKSAAKADRDLLDALSTRKTNVTMRNGEVYPADEPLIIEEEKLDIVSREELESMESVRRNMYHFAIEHEDSKMRAEKKKKARRLTARKFFETTVAIGLVILTGFFIMLLLYPQTELSELSRDNSNLKDSINTAKREIVDAEENVNGITDMDTIRAQALALGMQDPNQNQVVNLPIPNTDRLTTRSAKDSEGISDEAVEQNKDILADYYASHPER